MFYTQELSARDLVKVVEAEDGVIDYVWRDSINKKGKIVWWRTERVRYSADGNLKTHLVVDFSGDCSTMSYRIQRVHNQISGEKILTPKRLVSASLESVGFS